mmetsp:Transcript_106316/g.317735  ORF Transcript_106316/g.317735 Transcript_106316/m.317735 type:complete len:444 (+) Transcript_106316:75-1406(+)
MGGCCGSEKSDASRLAALHDQPVVGHFTTFFADSLGNSFGLNSMTDAEMEQAFHKMDKDDSGTIDRTEMAIALRELGKSERAIQKIMDGLEGDGLTYNEFKAILQGKAQPYTVAMNLGGYDVSMPNLAKIHDIPILGAFTGATQDLITGLSWSFMGVAFSAAFGGLNDEELLAKFQELDKDKSGRLNAKEIAAGLRSLRLNEADIKKITDKVGNNELDFDSFKALVRPVANQSVHDTPVVGHFTSFFADSFSGAFGYNLQTEEEMKATFNKIDKDKSGSLDKGEIADALRELGRPERTIQQLIDGMEDDTLNFEEFKALIEGKAQPYVTNVGIGSLEVPVPNLQKVHDIPVFGAFTGATQNLVVGMTWGLMGVAFSAAFGSMTDEQLKEQFDKMDTDRSGKLNAKEIGTALRKLNMNEADIKQIMIRVGNKEVDFEGFKSLVR